MQAISRYRLTPEQVHFSIDEAHVQALKHGHSREKVIGQPRAVEALKLALAINAKGYNVYAAGYTGTGKRSTVMRIIKEQPLITERLRDIAFVHNFVQPDRPRVITFPAGNAVKFRRRIQQLLDELTDELRLSLEQGAYRARRDEIMIKMEAQENQALVEFEKDLKREGFSIVQIKDGDVQRADIVPLHKGEPGSFEELQQLVAAGELSEKKWNAIRERYYQLMDDMNQIFDTLRVDRAQADVVLDDIRRETVRPIVDRLAEVVRREFPEGTVDRYLREFADDVVDNLDLHINDDPSKSDEIDQELLRYSVNVIVDHTETSTPPILFESHPDYHKLFGTQNTQPEQEVRFGFLGLRGGSVVQASGGYLVLRAQDVLTQEDVWNALKRVIQDGITEIRTPTAPYGVPVQSLKPDPIPVSVKVILMGSEHIYDLLFHTDEDFGELFKVLSEFDSVMDNTAASQRNYLNFIDSICSDEGLAQCDDSGKAAVLEYGVYLSEFRSKLSTRFALIADLLRESSHWARSAGRTAIDREAVEKARDVRRYLHNLPEEKFDEQIASGEMILQVDGSRIGSINGLSVLDRGYYAFGRPMLITARVAPGTDGIINIERESGLSGELHDKGVYIIQGFLQATYARDFPLSINASIGFEQSYVEIDGDSASSTEIYVLLSAIGDIPLRQDIAVTGSVNQFGQIQPVGGISEKIEGFHATCKLMGITGAQGVIIPRTNVQNLVLSREVQAAVRDETFHIYAISTVDEGMEILTDREAGKPDKRGRFPGNSINGVVERRLREMAQQVKDFSGD